MPRNAFYPSQKSDPQEAPSLYEEYENYDYDQIPFSSKPEHKPHPCCPPCHNHKPHCCCSPCHNHKPHCCCPPYHNHKPKHECKLISAQLSYNNDQEVAEGNPLLFATLIHVSDNNPNAPLYYKDGTITFNKPGNFFIHFGSDVHFAPTLSLPPNGNDVILALKLNGNIIPESRAHGRNTSTSRFGRQTLNKSFFITVSTGSMLQLVAEQNDNPAINDFLWTNLVIDEKCD